jgi:hypothetical protein
MNDPDRVPADLEARLRRLHSRLDTTAGFEPRLMSRIEASGSPLAAAERARLRSQLELEQLATRAWLRRRLYLGLVAAAAAAALGAGVAGLLGRLLGRALTALPSAAELTARAPGGSGAFAVVLLFAGWLWIVVRASARDAGSWQALVSG